MNFGLSGVCNMKSAFNKNIIKIIALMLSVAMLIGCFSACKKEKESNVEITLSQKDVTLDLYESVQLGATVKNSTSQVSWTTSDQTIVTVTDGKVLGLKEGVATITVSVDGKSAECEVTVWSSGAIPVLVVENQSITIDNGNALNIDCSLTYKNVKVLATMNYSSSAPDVVTVDQDGVISGKSVGTATITVTARYFNFETAKTVNVTVL